MANIKKYWNDMVENKGDNINALWWPNIERQHLTFNAFAKNIDFTNKTILDVGCGFCDFFQFLKKKKINVSYHGVDISTKMIDIAKKRKENEKIIHNLQCVDFTDKEYNISNLDYVVIIGTFNMQHGNNWELINNVIDKAFKICKKGVIFNLITTYVDYQEDYLYYCEPAKIIDLCKKYTPFINLINDYNKYEYLIIMYKEVNNIKYN